jgi:hypothetical protein
MPDPLVAPELQPRTGSAPTLASFVRQSASQAAVIAAARGQYKELPQSCPEASYQPTGSLIVYEPVRFDPDGTLASGIWTESVTVTGCGAPQRLNVLTLVQPGRPPARIPTMPGDSHADPATQKNALDYAQAVAARAAQPNCRRQTFTDAKFDGYTGLPAADIQAGRESRAWREVWSLFACGTTYKIELTFEPNARGIQLSATNPVKSP